MLNGEHGQCRQNKILKAAVIFDDMLEKGHIEECESPWSSPIVLVDKKTGDKRLWIDFRKVNDVTIKNALIPLRA